MNNRFIHLDMVRGMAALLVCASHLRGFLLVDFAQVQSPDLGRKFFYLLTGFGHQAVIVFFVLSGFFVGGSVVEACEKHRWSWSAYALRRMARLWLVLIPALLLTLAWDTAGSLLSGGDGYNGTHYHVFHSGPTASAPATLGWTSLAGNAFFLQTIYVPVYGTNGPLWSLANEFWYYLIFPIGYLSVRGAVQHRWRFWGALLLGTLLWWLPGNILWGGLAWLCGVLAHAAVRSPRMARWFDRWFVSAGVSAAFVITLLAARWGHWLGGDTILGVTFALLVPVLAKKRDTFVWYATLANRLASVSYSLYLAHFPLLAFIFFAFVAPFRLQPTWPALAGFVVLLGLVVAYGGLVWWCFERKTDSVRRRVEQWLALRGP